jgi:hypothetical protein
MHYQLNVMHARLPLFPLLYAWSNQGAYHAALFGFHFLATKAFSISLCPPSVDVPE